MPKDLNDQLKDLPKDPNSRESKASQVDMHSEAWWHRAVEGALTAEEQRLWGAHRQTCERCRLEWAAIRQIDTWLNEVKVESAALTPPPLSEGFTNQTVDRIQRTRRLRRLLSFLAGTLIVVVVSVLVTGWATSALTALGRGVNAAISARQVLFSSFVHIAVSLITTWKAALPYLVGFSLLPFLLLLPTVLIATLIVFWLAKRHDTSLGYASVHELQRLEV